MSKRAVFMVMVAGTNITTTLLPVLISLSVSDKVGTHSDTASLDIDDTDGRIVLPQIGAPVIVALGWEGEGVRVVFTGTVDEVRSSGSRGGGRTLSITAKGMDTTKKPKEGQQRHFDESTVEDILNTLLSFSPRRADIRVEVDPDRLRPIDADLQVPNTAKFEAHTGWKPQIPYQTTLRDLLDYWRSRVAAEGDRFLTR